jgi:hypothetical protein
MRIADSLKCRLIIYVAAGIVLALSLSFPTQMPAQVGYNAVCNATSPPTGLTCSQYVSSSSGVFDASTFTGSTICQKIYNTLTSSHYPATGAVVDARGITSGLTCSTTNETPWTSGSSAVAVPSVILLPAGLITISTGWILPDRTRIFGQGERPNPNAMSGPGTQILAAAGFSGTMISMGGASAYPNDLSVYPCGVASGICFGVSIADLMLNGNPTSNTSVVGIANTSSQELSYIDHINLYGFVETGLSITTVQAQNSGPYSNIVCNPTSSFTSGTVCIDINGVGDIRGIHGLTATAPTSGSGPSAAVLLDSNNSTLEDMHFEGFVDGILVGYNANAQSNTIFNVTGGTGTGPMTNVIEISNRNTVTDVSIMGVTTSSSSINSIKDDVTSTTLNDANLALYVLGDAIGGGHSRFTTSTSAVAPTWGVGALGSTGAPTGSCINGAIFSNTTGTAKHILFVCSGSAWAALPI